MTVDAECVKGALQMALSLLEEGREKSGREALRAILRAQGAASVAHLLAGACPAVSHDFREKVALAVHFARHAEEAGWRQYGNPGPSMLEVFRGSRISKLPAFGGDLALAGRGYPEWLLDATLTKGT